MGGGAEEEDGVAGRGPALLGDPDMRAAFDALIDNVAIGRPVRQADGRIVDFELLYMNAASVDGAGRSREELVGGRICDLFPEFIEQGIFDEFVRVVETGETWVADRRPYTGTTPEGQPIAGHWSLSVVRFGDGYLAASRDVTEIVAQEQARIAAEREAERNRVAADLLARAALPAHLPEAAGVDLAAGYRPAAPDQPVGGDWYDAFVLDDGRLGLVIADVTGHGPDAAAFMVQVRNVVRALALEHGEPERVLARANHVVLNLDEHDDLFATCAYHVLDPVSGRLRWARAGHFDPLRVGPGAAFLSSPAGLPLGVAPDAPYVAAEAELAAGTSILLFTDGLVDERGRGIADGLAGLLDAARGWDPARADGLVCRAMDVGNQADDRAVVAVRRVP